MGYSDYVKNIAGASGGQFMIRVADSGGQGGVINGNDVQFFIRSGLSSTFVGSPGFAMWAAWNGSGWQGISNLANYSGTTAWRHLHTVNITYDQDVGMRMPNYSGTSGFGGPDEFWVHVSRATIPQAPTPIGISQVQHQSFLYQFSGNWDGGSPIREWQIGYGYAGQGVQWTAPSNGTITVGTFIVGARIGIWSRGRNDVGWGPWSSELQVDLKRGCRVKYQGTYYHAIPHVKYSGGWYAAEPYGKTGKIPGVSDGTWKLAAYTG